MDRYWRRVRVSGALPLSVFADKVLTPIWGWSVLLAPHSVDFAHPAVLRVRNLHAHVFHDYSDGSLFGPTVCTYLLWLSGISS